MYLWIIYFSMLFRCISILLHKFSFYSNSIVFKQDILFHDCIYLDLTSPSFYYLSYSLFVTIINLLYIYITKYLPFYTLNVFIIMNLPSLNVLLPFIDLLSWVLLFVTILYLSFDTLSEYIYHLFFYSYYYSYYIHILTNLLYIIFIYLKLETSKFHN